jgi:hypothetical protein
MPASENLHRSGTHRYLATGPIYGATYLWPKMHGMKRYLASSDRDELARLMAEAQNKASADDLIAKVSMLSPKAIYEVEEVLGCLPETFAQRPSWSRLWRSADHVAPVLMFRALPEKNESGRIPLRARIRFKNRTGRQASTRWGSRIQRICVSA